MELFADDASRLTHEEMSAAGYPKQSPAVIEVPAK